MFSRPIFPKQFIACSLLFLLNCQNPQEFAIQDLTKQATLSNFRMISLTGTRDGDRMPVQIVIQSPSAELHLDLLFRIGVPTHLELGRYTWKSQAEYLEGRVRERSVTFLGGQSDNPNLGGVFELLSGKGNPLYKVTLPTSEVVPFLRKQDLVPLP